MTQQKREKLESYARKLLDEQFALIASAQAGGKLAKANLHINNATSANAQVWYASGVFKGKALNLYSFTCDLAVKDGQNVTSVDFSASGRGDTTLEGTFNSNLVGYFIVNPANIAGACDFTIAVKSGVGFSLTLYSTTGMLYGTFAGDADGIAVGYFSDSGELKVVA